MEKIVLMGNPNVGKSVVFSRLTGADVIAANYPGTTVDYTKGVMRWEKTRFEIIDAPGTYSLVSTNKAEEVARDMAKDADIIVNVLNATNLERNLFLTLELLERKIPVIIALNLWDEAKHTGVHIDVKRLEELLGVPVVPMTALTGEGIKELVSRLNEARVNEKIKPTSNEGRWVEIGEIIGKVEQLEHRHHSWRDVLADLTIRPVTGLPIALLVIAAAFLLVRTVGEGLINYVFSPLFEQLYLPLVESLSELLGAGWLHTLLIGQYGLPIDFEASLGMLTTGLYIPIGVVLPYIVAFYFMLSLLEDSGYMPRLATLVDNLFHKLGMHGHGVVPLFLGFGCNVPGALSTRTLETRKQRFIASTLLAIGVPCMAQTAMIFGALGSFGVQYIAMVFVVLFVVYVGTGLVLNRLVKGESPEIFLEIPAYRRPSLKAILKKTWMRIRWFLREAIPFLFIGVAVVNIAYAVGVMDWISSLLSPVMEVLFGLPGDASVALVVGFIRKDLAVGMLLPLGLSANQLVVAVSILAIYFPCVATFVVLLREMGWGDMLKSSLVIVSVSLCVGFVLKLVLLGV